MPCCPEHAQLRGEAIEVVSAVMQDELLIAVNLLNDHRNPRQLALTMAEMVVSTYLAALGALDVPQEQMLETWQQFLVRMAEHDAG